LRALGVFNPTLRGIVEMAYEFEEPFVLDTTKFQSEFGTTGTPLDVAVATTVKGFRGEIKLSSKQSSSLARKSLIERNK
jgi:hypothetical protein